MSMKISKHILVIKNTLISISSMRTISIKMTEKRFERLYKFDIQSCFDSIYSHSFTWAVSGGKEEYKKHLNGKAKSFGDDWDNIMQKMNYNETNGIVIGPEFSRIFAEIILQYIDKKVKQTLLVAGYNFNEHYCCYRYVDDIFFYYNDEKSS